MTEASDLEVLSRTALGALRTIPWDVIERILDEFEPCSASVRAAIRTQLADIGPFYSFAESYAASQPNLTTQKQRLLQIADTARKLRMLLAGEPMLDNVLGSGQSHGSTHLIGWDDLDRRKVAYMVDWDEVDRRQTAVLSILRDLETGADNLRRNQPLLELLRGDPGPSGRGRSVERLRIWEPVLQMWVDAGKRLGTSDCKPIRRIISLIHEALGISAPKDGAVQQAIRDFSRGHSRSR